MRIFETGFDAGTTQYGIFGTGVEGDCRSAHGHGFSTFRKGCCIHERAPVVSESIVAVISPSLEEDPAAQGGLYKAVVGGRTGAGAVGTEKIFREKLEEHCTKGTASAVFLSDLADQVAVHKGLYDAEEVDELVAYFPKIRSNMLKNSFFYILLANDFFLQEELPSLYSENLNSMLFDMTNVLRKRLKLSLLRPGESSNSN